MASISGQCGWIFLGESGSVLERGWMGGNVLLPPFLSFAGHPSRGENQSSTSYPLQFSIWALSLPCIPSSGKDRSWMVWGDFTFGAEDIWGVHFSFMGTGIEMWSPPSESIPPSSHPLVSRLGTTHLQGGITCGAIDEPRKSSKAIDERVIINFRDKNVVIARFLDKNVYR